MMTCVAAPNIPTDDVHNGTKLLTSHRRKIAAVTDDIRKYQQLNRHAYSNDVDALTRSLSSRRPIDQSDSLNLSSRCDWSCQISSLASVSQSGDLLLFKGKGFGVQLQRYLTCSDYDHIAIVLRSNDDLPIIEEVVTAIANEKSKSNCYILEAVQTAGVICSSWETFLKKDWLNLYHDKVVLRQLITKRNSQFQQQIWEFAYRVVGTPYHLSLMKIVRHSIVGRDVVITDQQMALLRHQFSKSSSQLGRLTQRSIELFRSMDAADKIMSWKRQLHLPLDSICNDWKKSDYFFPFFKMNKSVDDSDQCVSKISNFPSEFFCSELIAECYKYVGVFSSHSNSASYWPVCFTLMSFDELPFNSGSKLSQVCMDITKRHCDKHSLHF